jgi:prepilin-type processing-associated H-X9-DG protein
MTTMTAQLPLPLAPAAGVPIGLAACLVEDDDGGRVFLNGQLSFVWDAGDVALRRFAAVQLVRIKAARSFQVAAAFGVNEFSLYRWGLAITGGGSAALVPAKRGPKGPSKLTDQVIAEVAGRHALGQTAAEIAAAVGISTRSVSLVLARVRAGSGSAAGPAAPPTGRAAPESDPAIDPDSDIDCAQVDSTDPVDTVGSGDGAAVAGSVATGTGAVPVGDPDRGEPVLPVLPDPVDRSAERAAARWGLLPYAPPVFAPAAGVRLAGLFLAVLALTATGLLDSARQVYGGVPDGFYGLATMLVEAVCRALVGEPRAEGATRVNPTDLGRVLGLDRAPEVKTVRRKLGVLATRGKPAELLSAQAVRHATNHQEAMSVLYVDGHVRTYHGTRKLQKTHVPRLRFPAPATVETWIVDAQGAPVWVVMAQPGASLAAEIRRLLPDIRRIVGDDRRVLVGFDRGGWSRPCSRT